MDENNELMNALVKAQQDIEADKIDELMKHTQYSQAIKTYQNPILRVGPGSDEPGQFGLDNYPNGYNINGWQALKETPQDKLMRLLEKKRDEY